MIDWNANLEPNEHTASKSISLAMETYQWPHSISGIWASLVSTLRHLQESEQIGTHTN